MTSFLGIPANLCVAGSMISQSETVRFPLTSGVDDKLMLIVIMYCWTMTYWLQKAQVSP